ncbi:MAG: cysteine synthase A [Ruminococcaceae bacterium]|nr:cysteine synthase A [Oscillospiraceae bacterium]
MKIYNSICDLVGKTPLVEFGKLKNEYNISGKLIAKLECFNPAGSVKDRVGLNMILDAERNGVLKKGDTIIEPTSGNTGIGLASYGASRGYRVILTMPDTMSVERRNLLKAYGAQIILTEGKLGMKGAIEKAEEIQKSIPGSIIAGQFVNKANPDIHYQTTGPEIWEDTDGKIDVFVAGIGTGGTITGVAKYLKEKNPSVKIIGYEPYSSPYFTKGEAGSHKIQGIGAGFKPYIYDESLVDEVITVKDEDAYHMANFLAKNEGVLIGVSSGGALFAATEIMKRDEYKDKTVVVLLPDSGERYLSCGLFD